ncbi:holo-ACP synthase [Actinomyces sp. B33]|uniref:holo-ACP synthase n=1 Tax=Actinomyces sp. B33 TaxID=2942131 RepID=UPI00233FEA1D|nr:holo-ACP synthase [Actinomyces sp. B33]MDC4232388.1 holo-ACP synthase [Actinomyces sp. B33]
MSGECRGEPPVGAPLVGWGQGVDLVDLASFADQLGAPGSVFPRVFTDREWARCASRDAVPGGAGGSSAARARPGTRAVESLGARWAAKEAVVKAWSQALDGEPPPIPRDELDFSQIEVVVDRWGRPSLRFHGGVARALDSLARSRGARASWGVSLSHDGPWAIAQATVLLLADPGPRAPRP